MNGTKTAVLEVKTLERTVILLGNGGGLEHRVFELLAIGCRVHDEDGHKKQSLIAGLEILQQTLCLTAEGGKIGRDNVHIVAGADCLFLLFDLHLVEVGDFHFDALDCLRLVNRPDMKIDRDVAVHLKEVGKHTVIEFRREDLQEAHRADGSAHLEALAFTEVKGSGRDEVLRAESCPGNHVKGKAERLKGSPCDMVVIPKTLTEKITCMKNTTDAYFRKRMILYTKQHGVPAFSHSFCSTMPVSGTARFNPPQLCVQPSFYLSFR